MENISGIIFDLMRYSIHDGPGIRTTVFFKGCPLNCLWCHNPESQKIEQEIMLRQTRCTGCGACAPSCPRDALDDPVHCTLCGSCTRACPSGAREMVGRRASVKDVLREIEKDLIFYDESGGGATFSGGEPLMQPEFLLSLLQSCREKEIHTAVETCGFAPGEMLKKIAKYVDLFLYDLKIIDEAMHKKYTGVSNRLILENLKQLCAGEHEIIVRVPVIPGINDSEANIKEIGALASSLGKVKEIHLLPYHHGGVEKYRASRRTYQLPLIQPPGHEQMRAIEGILEQFGLKVKIGG